MSEWIYIILAFIIFDAIATVFIIINHRRKKVFLFEELEYMKAHWIRIIDSCPTNPLMSVMDADKLLDYALGIKGFKGPLGEKLKLAENYFTDINGVWSAHKLRNRAAHEMGNLHHDEANRALRNFKKALNDLGAKL